MLFFYVLIFMLLMRTFITQSLEALMLQFCLLYMIPSETTPQTFWFSESSNCEVL